MKTAPVLYFRVDADSQMGTGHLMRCVALAQAWKRRGGECLFITRCQNPSLTNLLIQCEFDTHFLDKTYPDPKDLTTTLDAMAEMPGAPIVIDGYAFDAAYVKELKQFPNPVIVIDDRGLWSEYPCDLLLNQNPDAAALNYQTAPETLSLLGLDYVLIRSEFLKLERKRKPIGEMPRVFLSFGGADPLNLTPVFLKALSDEAFPQMQIDVVVGATNPHVEEIQEAAQASGQNVILYPQGSAIGKTMQQADFAVSAAGTTALELAYLGVPTALVITAQNQVGIGNTLAQQGMAILLGQGAQIDLSKAKTTLVSLLKNELTRASLSQKAQGAIDGKGVDRVVQAIFKLAYGQLKKAA